MVLDAHSLAKRAAALCVLLILGTGCPQKHADATDAATDLIPPASTEPVSTPSANAGVWAANASDVARFADEVPFGPFALIAHDNTTVQKSPGGGGAVSTLPAGTEVVKLAAHGDQDLVCFDDPKPGGLHLMGWVPQSALQETTPPTPGPGADDGGAPPQPDPTPPHKGHHHKKRPPRHQ